MWYRIAVLLISLAIVAVPACADGMLLPARPEVEPFSVVYHRVTVKIDRQVATTEIDQAFHNHTRRQVEGTYIFPLNDNISIAQFSMYAGNEELEHRILDKDAAARIYSDIVRTRQDPALLEWMGTRAIRARVFPIEPNADKRIRIAYQEVLGAQGGAIKYVYPLKTEKLSAQPLQECAVDITIRSEQPIRSVYSPSHDVTVRRVNDRTAEVSYTAKNTRPDQDLVLYYTVSEENLGMSVLTYRDPQRGDGYFLLLAAPKADLRDDVQPKDVIFVIDTSGSMAGAKMEQAKGALKFCLNSLDPRDRFNVVPFSSTVEPWRGALQPATREEVREAETFAGKLTARGGTAINDALLAALEMLGKSRDESRPLTIIFLTDGQPTVGESNVERILANVKTANARNVRIFDFGVGSDYHAHFLDKLAEMTNGFAENVLPQEDIEVKVSDFYGKVSSPLLMNLKLDWGGAEVYDLYPRSLPDLFKGSQLLVTGRYRAEGKADHLRVRLSGEAGGHRHTFEYPVTLPRSRYDDEFIPRLWATRKIGFLEDEARLRGANKELIEEIIRLSKEFGILTEYTSFLVDMDVNVPATTNAPRLNAFTKNESELAAEAQTRVEGLRTRVADASAVSQSVNRKASMHATQAASSSGNYIITDEGRRVQLSQMRNVSQRSFVQNGRQWVDVHYRPTQRMVNVKAYSPAYFQLANAHPRMAQYLSMGGEVIVTLKDTAINAGPAGREQEFTVDELKDLQRKMSEEFGMPVATVPPTMTTAAAAPHTVSGWALLAVPPLAVMRLCRRRKNQA